MNTRWHYYRLYVLIGERPADSVNFSISRSANARFRALELGIAPFYRANRDRIHAAMLTHYYQTASEDIRPGGTDHVTVNAGDYTEFIRLRMRIDDDDAFMETLERTMIEPLLAGENPPLKGWSRYEYDAAADIGTRFGDPERGVDVTDAAMKMMTGIMELRFVLNEHPEFTANHDLVHLYCNSLGLGYMEEIEALEKRVKKMKDYMERPRG